VYWDNVARNAAQYVTAGDERETVPANSPLVDIFIQGIRQGAGQRDQSFLTMGELSSWIKRRMRNDRCYNQRLTPQTGAIPLRSNNETNNQGEMVFLVPADDGRPIRTTWDCEDDEGDKNASFGATPTMPFLAMSIPARFQPDEGQGSIEPSPEASPRHRPMDAAEAVRNEVIEAPYADTASLFDGLRVYYDRKTRDQRRVLNALDALDVSYYAGPAQLDASRTNMLECHPNLSGEALRTLALALMENGVEIRRIARFERDRYMRRNRIEVSSDATAMGLPPLTREQVIALNECPEDLHN
jgi:hypothetical protein